MIVTGTFEGWAVEQLGLTDDDIDVMQLEPVLDVFISRMEDARARGADDPLKTITAKVAGGNSRACTKRMLQQLGFAPPARRALHRLLAGSPSGWPGLLRLFAEQAELTRKQRHYARRQVQVVRSQATGSRNGSRAACSASAVTP
jgi:hypothetical protein